MLGAFAFFSERVTTPWAWSEDIIPGVNNDKKLKDVK